MLHYKLTIFFVILSVTAHFGDASPPMAGGVRQEDPSEPIFGELAKESLVHYFQTSDASQSFAKIVVEEATTQIVAGVKTTLTFVAYPAEFGYTIRCDSSIVSRAWLNEKDFDVSCQNAN